jgi:hypothetical protein
MDESAEGQPASGSGELVVELGQLDRGLGEAGTAQAPQVRLRPVDDDGGLRGCLIPLSLLLLVTLAAGAGRPSAATTSWTSFQTRTR